jgi:hypothetical protein
MKQGSMDCDYCQGLLLMGIVRTGTGKWRELKELAGVDWLVMAGRGPLN